MSHLENLNSTKHVQLIVRVIFFFIYIEVKHPIQWLAQKNKKGKGEQPKNPSQHKRTQTLLKNLTRILLRRKGMTSLKIYI